MKKKTYTLILNKISKTSILFSLVILLSFAYIACVYKTVTIASNYEIERISFSELQTVVGEKEHSYIVKTSTIDMEEAVKLGYERSAGNVAYLETEKDIELAVR